MDDGVDDELATTRSRRTDRGTGRRRLALAALPLLLLPLPALASGRAPATPVPAAVPGGVTLTPVAQVGLDHEVLGDMAFWGDRLVVSAGVLSPSSGFSVLDISRPADPQVLSTVTCYGPAGDVSVWEDLVLLSVDPGEGDAADRCDRRDPRVVRSGGWGGLRIFSIAEPTAPVEVAGVLTCMGSHTHTLVPDLDHQDAAGRPDPRLVVYVPTAECTQDERGDRHRHAGAMEVVEVPLRHPRDARVLDDAVAYRFGNEALPKGCHDVTVLLSRRLAHAACSASGSQLWDISDPARPVVLSTFARPGEEAGTAASNVNPNHAGVFSPDGTVLGISEEAGGGFGDVCNGTAEDGHGRYRFYDVSDPHAPRLLSAYKTPERSSGGATCTAHNGAPVHTTDGRRLLVTGWYGAGVTVVDVTDPQQPRHVGGHRATRVPLSEQRDELRYADPGAGSVAFAAYEYRGHVYVTNTPETLVLDQQGNSRGLEVLRLDGVRTRVLPRLNPQVQEYATRG